MTITPASGTHENNNRLRKETKERRGVAITALVLGIVAIAGSPLPILNNATIICGFIGIPFGIIGLLGVKKTTAAVGLVLSIGGVVFGLLMQKHWGDELDKIGDEFKQSIQQASYKNDPLGGIELPIESR